MHANVRAEKRPIGFRLGIARNRLKGVIWPKRGDGRLLGVEAARAYLKKGE